MKMLRNEEMCLDSFGNPVTIILVVWQVQLFKFSGAQLALFRKI